MYTFRAIEENDLDDICSFPQNQLELYYMFPRADFPLEKSYFEEHLKTRHNSNVFLCNNEICGFANFYDLEESKHCWIGNLVVNPTFRNKGVGQFIIETMESEARKLYNVKKVQIACINDNTAGLLLYEKLGYIPFKMEKRIGKDGENRILVMMKKLFDS